MLIGWYVPHGGAGAVARARTVAAELGARGHEVQLLGSGPGVDVPLPSDHDETPEDPTANDALYWAPLRNTGLRDRMGLIGEWLRARVPALMVVDGSVEVTLLSRLFGIPTVVLAHPGDLDDDAHRTACTAATAILAPWPATARPCRALAGHPRLHTVGGISALASPSPASPDGAARDGHGVLLPGTHGPDGALLAELAAAVPELEWTQLQWTPAGWTQSEGTQPEGTQPEGTQPEGTQPAGDPAQVVPLLDRAAVVVARAGQNTVADVAARRVPAVLVPHLSAHAEQQHLAAEVARMGLAVAGALDGYGRPDWAQLVAAARELPDRWELWATDGAAARAADVLERLARQESATSS